MRKHLLLFVLPFFTLNLNAQGPVDGFYKSKNEFDIAFSGIGSFAKKFYAGRKLVNIERNQTMISAYANLGLSNRWDLIISAPFINFTPQDLGIYGKLKIVDRNLKSGNFSFGAALGTTFPMSNYTTESAQSIGQQAITIQPILLTQYRHKSGFFIHGQARFNYAFNPTPSSLAGTVKLGYAGSKWYADLWYDIQEGFGDKDYQGDVEFNSFKELVNSYQRIGGVVYYSISSKLGVFVNGAYTLNGRNTSQSTSVGAGLVVKFKKKPKKEK